MFQFSVRVLAASSLALVMVGCGGAQSQFIKDFSVKFRDNDVTVTAEFSKSVPLNTELLIPVQNYGFLKLIPATAEKGFQIQTILDTSAWLDKEFLKNRVNTLPNGMPLPSFVSTDLSKRSLTKGKQYATNLYLGTNLEKKYLGAGVELQFIDGRFPASLALTQKILDSSQKEIGAVTLYGPKMVGGFMESSGGVFFITDVALLRAASQQGKPVQFANSMLTRKIPLFPYDAVDVSAADASVAREYKKPSKQLNLLQLFNAHGKESGIID